ncbi:MAG: hypothetical protein AAF211_08380, partial [Myxococcota bacterium]
MSAGWMVWSVAAVWASDGVSFGADERGSMGGVDPDYGAGADFDSVEVLAINGDKGVAAFRRITRGGRFLGFLGEDTCDYPGVAPDRGVELGVFDLAKGQTTELWVVYELEVPDGGCTPFEVSKARLTTAKARFGELGLAIDKPPEPLPLAAAGFEVRTEEIRWSRFDDESCLDVAVWRGPRKVYGRTQDTTAAASKIEFATAFRVNERTVVLMECIETVSAEGATERCSLTPAIDAPRPAKGLRADPPVFGDPGRHFMGAEQRDELGGDDFEGIEILAIDAERGRAAFRRITRASRGEGPAGDACDYPGIAPGRGVELGVFDFHRGTTTNLWPVYEQAPASSCTAFETSQARLAEAKAHFAERGL